jgi:uncharacterized membrane protein YphA (DoxX/SURF4 family)
LNRLWKDLWKSPLKGPAEEESSMNKLTLVARTLLGLFFLTFGLNGFFNFLPTPEFPEPAAKMMAALAETGFFFPFLKTTETTSGLLLLVGSYVPLALVVLAPVVLNILMFHLFLAPSGILPGLVALILGVYLAWAYRDSFRGVLDRSAPIRSR